MPVSDNKPRRVRHDIICQMLEAARDGTRKTRMMFRMGLSYSQLTRYLAALEKVGLIGEKSELWQTTESGIKVIEACRTCQGLMNQIGLSETNPPDRTKRPVRVD